MIRACWLVVLLLAVSTARPQTPTSAKEPIDKLIEKLTDEDFAVRRQAAQDIEARGLEALPALRLARKHDDPEVRRQIESWIPNLERQEILSPRRINLQATNRPVRELVEAIAKQTGYKIELYQDAEREKRAITIDLKDLTLWEALDRVCVASGAVIQHGYGDQIVRLHFMDHHVPFVHRDGAFRLTGQGFHLGRSVNFGTIPNQPDASDERHSESLSFSMTMCSEPRLPLLGSGMVKVSKAVDDLGNDLRLDLAEGEARARVAHYWGGHRSSSLSLSAQLRAPAKNARTMKVIEGSVPITLLIRQETIELTNDVMAAKDKKYTAGKARIHVVDLADKGNGRYELKLDITHADNNGDGSWLNTLYSRIEMTDGQGNKLPLYGSSMSQNGNNMAQVGFTFGGLGGEAKPAKLIYHDWTTMQHEVPFQFRELPLP